MLNTFQHYYYRSKRSDTTGFWQNIKNKVKHLFENSESKEKSRRKRSVDTDRNDDTFATEFSEHLLTEDLNEHKV